MLYISDYAIYQDGKKRITDCRILTATNLAQAKKTAKRLGKHVKRLFAEQHLSYEHHEPSKWKVIISVRPMDNSLPF